MITKYQVEYCEQKSNVRVYPPREGFPDTHTYFRLAIEIFVENHIVYGGSRTRKGGLKRCLDPQPMYDVFENNIFGNIMYGPHV